MRFPVVDLPQNKSVHLRAISWASSWFLAPVALPVSDVKRHIRD